MKRVLTALLLLIMASACAPVSAAPTASPDYPSGDPPPTTGDLPAYAPQPGDDGLVKGTAFVTSAEINLTASLPAEIHVLLKGSLPTPCNQLRIIPAAPDAEHKIKLDVYSVSNPDRMCAQVIQPYEQVVILSALPAGHYTLWAADQQLAEFNAP